MTISAGEGHSTHSGSERAGEEAVKEAISKSEEQPEIIFLFASSEKDGQKVLKGANNQTDADIVGCSTAGEIMGKESYTKSVVALALGGDTLNAKIGKGQNLANGEKAGEEAAESMLAKFGGNKDIMVSSNSGGNRKTYPKVLGVAMACGLIGDNQELMSGITNKAGSMQIGGGWAADDWALEKTQVYYNDEVFDDSLILAGLELDVKSGTGVAHGIHESAKQVEITTTEGKRVKEIDGQPALDVYRELFGKRAENSQFLLTKPIGINTQEEELRVREPLSLDARKGDIEFSESVPEGITVDIMDASADQILEGAKKAIEKALEDAGNPEDIKAILVHDCACRWYFLNQDESLERELENVVEEVGEDVPVVGWYTYGEIASPASLNGVRHQSMVIQVISGEKF